MKPLRPVRLAAADPLRGTKDYELGPPVYVCSPMDHTGRERVEEQTTLLYYEAHVITEVPDSMVSDIPIVNELGTRSVSVDKPVAVLVPSTLE